MVRHAMRNVVIAAVAGSLLGSLAGWLAALVVWQGYRGLARCWGSDRRDPWHSRLLGVLLLLAGTVLGGWLGLLEGGKRGVNEALREGPVGRELLPQVGNAGADLLMQVDHVLQKPGRTQDPEALEAFRAGKGKLDANRLKRKITRLETASGRIVADYVLRRTLDENPQLKGQVLETLLTWVLPRIVVALVDEARPWIREEFDPHPFLDLLVAHQGDREGLDRPELSAFLVDRVVLPDTFVTLERQVSQTQRLLGWGLAGLAGATLLLGLAARPFRKPVPPSASE
jgi:hypothetical protein